MSHEDILALLILLVPYPRDTTSQTLTRGVQLGLISPHQMESVMRADAFLWANAVREYKSLTQISYKGY